MRRVTVESGLRVAITSCVGVIGAAAGFHHTHDAAIRAGQVGWMAWADAVVIECMVVVAGLQLATRKTAKERILPGAVLVIAFLIQMGAQVSGAPVTFAGWLFAAIPALGCLVVVKFALHGVGGKKSQVEESSEDVSLEADAERMDVIQPESAPVRELETAVLPTSTWGRSTQPTGWESWSKA